MSCSMVFILELLISFFFYCIYCAYITYYNWIKAWNRCIYCFKTRAATKKLASKEQKLTDKKNCVLKEFNNANLLCYFTSSYCCFIIIVVVFLLFFWFVVSYIGKTKNWKINTKTPIYISILNGIHHEV